MIRCRDDFDAAIFSQCFVAGATLSQPLSRKALFLVRAGLGVLLGAVLSVGFLAYLSPSMRLNWETIASMCGF
jgi:hypothetical protein